MIQVVWNFSLTRAFSFSNSPCPLKDNLYKLTYFQVAKESADVIVLDDNFTTIINVARWGRAVYINIQKFVQFQLTVNIVALVINFVSACITGAGIIICTSVSFLQCQY